MSLNHSDSLKSFAKGRKKARRLSMQALYSWHLSNNELKDIEDHTLLEHAEDHFDRDYFKELLYQVPSHLLDIEKALTPHLSRPILELDPIELSVLQIATFELLKRPDIPYKVVINEALELVKMFGATESHKFVNGVLDKVARDLRQSEILG